MNELLKRLSSQFEQFIASRSTIESEEMLRRRRTLFDQFLKEGFPTQKHEDWKYVRMSHFLDEQMMLYIQHEQSVLPVKHIHELVAASGGNTLVFINGYFARELSDICGGCVEVDILEPDLNTAVENEDPFSLLQRAFAREYIKCTATDVVEDVTALFYTFSNGVPLFVQPRVLFHLEDGGEMSLIEKHIHVGEQECLTTMHLSLELGVESKMKHYRIQNFSAPTRHIHSIQVKQEEKSSYEAVTISSGAALVRNTHVVTLEGEAATASLYGAYLQEAVSFVDNHITIDHQASNTKSVQVYKGTLDHKAVGVFNGKVHVAKGVYGIASEQSNKTMLLSEDARMNTKPELQIYADDVQCTHGAAIGSLDEHVLMYMRSRGIGEQKAKYLLTAGFCSDILDKIEEPELKDTMNKDIKTRFLLE